MIASTFQIPYEPELETSSIRLPWFASYAHGWSRSKASAHGYGRLSMNGAAGKLTGPLNTSVTLPPSGTASNSNGMALGACEVCARRMITWRVIAP